MIRTAKLLEAPRLRDGVRIARAAIQPGGQIVHARIMPPAAGVYLPYARGNSVILAVAHGDPNAGAYVIGRFTQPPAAREAGNIEFHAAGGHKVVIDARSGDVVVVSESGSVLLGAEEPDTDYARLVTHAVLDARLKSLQQQVDALVANLNTAVSGGGPLVPAVPATAGVWTTAMQAYAVPPPRAPNGPDPTHKPADANEDAAARNVYAKPVDPVD